MTARVARAAGCLLLVACSDYDVAHSELIAVEESGQITLAADAVTVVTVEATADSAALAAIGTSYLDLTTFAIQEDGAPWVYVTAEAQTVDGGVGPTALLELTIDDIFARCLDESAPGPEPAPTADGGCAVTVPVTVRVEGGAVSFQVDAHAQINFGKEEPPGTLTLTVR